MLSLLCSVPFTAWFINGLRWYDLPPTENSPAPAKSKDVSKGKGGRGSTKHRPSKPHLEPISETNTSAPIEYDLSNPLSRSISISGVLQMTDFDTFNLTVRRRLL